jgi:spore germination cell wall hydrolase CwlJ-like protein
MMIKKLAMVSTALFVLTGATSHDIEIHEAFQMHSPNDVQCLALNIYHESRNESLAGQVAVADVTVNRMFDTRYPNTICGVVYQAKLSEWHLEQGREVPARNKCQFSWYCDGKSDEPKDGDSWESAKLIASNFLTYGEYRGITEGATHYHAGYVNPYWIHDRGMQRVGSIGEHIFYRWN